MAATANTTLLTDLFVPEVVADSIDRKLIDAIRFAPLARINTDLVGRDGDELTMPAYDYVGMAEDVIEGADIPIKKLNQTTEKVKVSKIGLGVQFTDESLLSGDKNRIADEAAMQIVTSINDKLEDKLLNAMSTTATLIDNIAADDDGASGIANALLNFGEDIDGDKVLVVPPSFYGRLLNSNGWIPNTEIGADIIIRGAVGAVYGAQIVLSNRLALHYSKTTDTSIVSGKTYYTYNSTTKQYTVVSSPDVSAIGTYYEQIGAQAYIIKPGALSIAMKRDTLVEFDRDPIDQTNYIIGSKIFAPYVYDKSKLIKLNLA